MAELMERNLNLEEVDSDAMFGLKALKDQSLAQKIVFFGTISLGVLLNVALPLIFDISRIICVAVFLVLIVIGVGYGCNYSKGLTYGRYVYQIIFKPTKELKFESTMGKEQLKVSNEELIKAEDKKLSQSVNTENQRKMIKKLIIIIAAIVLVVSFAITIKVCSDNKIHHTVELQEEY